MVLNKSKLLISLILLVLLIILGYFLITFSIIINNHSHNSISIMKHNIELYNKINGTLCKINHPIYYINMDKDIKRRDFMEGQLRIIANKYKRIAGINGTILPHINYGKIGEIEYYNYYSATTDKELGCILSHLLAILTAYKNKDDIAIICEDDASFDTCALTSDIDDVIKNAPPNWEMIQLYSGSINYGKLLGYSSEERAKNKTIKFMPYDLSTWSNLAYIINYNGMKKIIKRVIGSPFVIKPDKDGKPASGVADVFIPFVLNTYYIVPPIIGNNISLDSTIHQSHVDTIHAPALFNFLSIINDRILSFFTLKLYLMEIHNVSFIHTIMPYPIVDDINKANIIVYNILPYKNKIYNKYLSYDDSTKFIILIDSDNQDMFNLKNVDLIISSKILNNKHNIPTIYFPRYASMMLQYKLDPYRLIKSTQMYSSKNKFCACTCLDYSLSHLEVKKRIEFYNLCQKLTGDKIDPWKKYNNTLIGNINKELDNIEIYKRYKFVMIFEHNNSKGYISEMIIYSMLARSIPIYFGTDSIAEHFNSKSFINIHNYSTWEECINHIIKLDRDDDAYNNMLNEPWFVDNKLNSYLNQDSKMMQEIKHKISNLINRKLSIS